MPLDIQRNESFRMVAKRYPDGIFLCGYSRGAHIAIKVAEMLAGADVPVAAMFLFDAVDKDAYMNSKRVPMNVANVYHAIRTDNNRSRWYFGHTGMGQRLDEKRRLCGLIDEAHIDGTHAALGGLPWCGDHPRLRGQLVYAAASVSTFFIANALHMSPRLASSMSSLAGNLASPQTLSKQDDDKAAKEAYEFMKERTARHGISWEWSAPQPAVAGGGGGRSW
ncbi:MAG TPA: hypothetical protein PK359_02705 [Burkholderiaceae bacterium]|nr:hypothetical protein [Burkholderiaceae bacterium]